MTATPLEVNVEDETLMATLAGGATNPKGGARWRAFRSWHAPRFVPDGISTGDDEAWAAEFHTDGYFGAALWSFPGLPEPEQGPYLAAFHAEAFLHFSQLATALYKVARCDGPLDLTCSILASHTLRFWENHRWEPPELTSVRRSEVHLRIRRCNAVPEVLSVGRLMMGDFFHAFGQEIGEPES